jgi:hypothetical protein
MPNPEATPAVAAGGRLSPEWVRYFSALLTYIDGLGTGGATDHGALTGLSDDDHPQYQTDARGDARYSLLDHGHTQLHDRSHAVTSTADHTAGNWKVFYSNGSGQVTELALGALDEVLKSGGPAAPPVFGAVSGGSGLTQPQVMARGLGS